MKEHIPCPHSNHTSSGLSANSSERCSPNQRQPPSACCHRLRIFDRTVFEKLVQVLVFGCAYERIAGKSCSATALRRRRDDHEEWVEAGAAMGVLRGMALKAYDKPIGPQLCGVAAVDSRINKGSLWRREGGQKPGRPGQTRHQTLRAIVDAKGIPLGAIAAPANRHDSPLLDETPDTLEVLGESCPSR